MRAAASPKARRTKNEATSPEPGRAVTATDMELLYTHSSNRVRLITYSDLPQRGTRRRPHISRSRTKDEGRRRHALETTLSRGGILGAEPGGSSSSPLG